MAADGLHEEGVFRVAPDGKRCDVIEEYIFGACFLSAAPLREFAPDAWRESALSARMVKRFFRVLPEGGLVPLAEIVKAYPSLGVTTVIKGEQVPAMLELLGPRRRAVFLWLLDWLSGVAAHEASTRMDPNNLAIVFGPNLYEQKGGAGEKGHAVDPSTAIKYSKIINEFMRAALQWRMDTMGVVTAPTPRGAGGGGGGAGNNGLE
jgi:hypothetical protein